MEEQESYLLITRYLSKQTTTEENEQLADWLSASTANEQTFQEVKAIWLAAGRTESGEASIQLGRLKRKIEQGHRAVQPLKRRPIYQIAAVTAGLLLIAAACLFLTGKVAEPVNVQLVTRPGEKKLITLNDGTVITLGPQSAISYPENFRGDNRNVSLDGEAYFEVSKDPHRPFVVHAGTLNIEVLGTHFNVNADRKRPLNSVALTEGSVAVWFQHDREERYLLKPGQQLDINKDKQQVFQHPLDSLTVLGWLTNTLSFNNEKLGDVAPRIERMYGVKLVFADQETADTHVYARFENEPLKKIFDHFAATGVLSYESEGNKIYIRSSSKKKE